MPIRFYVAPQTGDGLTPDTAFRSILHDFITVGYHQGTISGQSGSNIITGNNTLWVTNPIISHCIGFARIGWQGSGFIAKIISIDSDGQITIDRPVANTFNNLPYSISLESFQEIDNPARRISICCVTAAAATHTAIAADARVIVASPLFTSIDDVPTGLQATFNNLPGVAGLKMKLEAIGINTAWISDSNSIKDAIRYVFRVFATAQIADGEANSHIKDIISRNLDTQVKDVPLAIRNGVKTWMQNKGLAIGWIANDTMVREILHFIVSNLGIGYLKMIGQDF